MSVIDTIISQLVFERDRIERALSILRADITSKPGTTTVSSIKRRFSAETRRRMAAGQKQRWAALRGQVEPEAAPPKQALRKTKKRKLSAAGLAAIRAGIAKRWAKIKASQKAPAMKKTAAKKTVASSKSTPVAAKKASAKKGARNATTKAVRKSDRGANPAPVAEAAATTA